MSEAGKGVAAMVAACTFWGLSSLFYHLLDHVPAPEVLAYRTLWSFLFFACVLLLQGRLRVLWQAVTQGRQALLIGAAGLFIGINWFCFIYSVHNGHAMEASLGYYIFPLVAVLLGRVYFKEALSAAQWLAVALAGVAVAVLTIGLGVPPWIALVIAGSFGIYGIVKKRLDLGPVVSVTAEVMLLSPLAIGWIWFAGSGAGGGNPLGTHLLLALSGPLTGAPLILFSFAARRVRLGTVGLVQYLNPTLQFGVATLIFLEPFTPWHAIAFPVIWVALAIYSGATFRQDRASRRAVSRAAVS